MAQTLIGQERWDEAGDQLALAAVEATGEARHLAEQAQLLEQRATADLASIT